MKKSARAARRLVVPAGVDCLQDAGLLIWRPRGVLDEEALNELLAFLGSKEGRLGKPFNRFTDLSLIDAVDLTFKYVFHFALHRRLSRVGQVKLKSAILTTSPAAARYAKLHALLTDHSPLEVKMFKTYGAAAKWLNVSPEILEPSA